MIGTFLIYLRKEVQATRGTDDEPSERDKQLMHRDPESSSRYSTEFENRGGLNLWRHPFEYYCKARIRDSPQNAEFKRILQRNITTRYTDDKGRDVVEVSQNGAETALNQTVWLKYWNKKTGEDEFYVVIVPHNVYAQGMSKPMFVGKVSYNPKLVTMPLMGSLELQSVSWKQQRLVVEEKGVVDVIRDVFDGRRRN